MVLVDKKRSSSFELMRILSMLMVCAFHWQLHGYNDNIPYSILSGNQIVSFVLGSWGILGVNLFFLLSFYFLIQKQKVNYKRIFGLIIKVSIYGTTILLLAYAIGIVNFNIIEMVKSILGIFAYQYWFITVYIIVAVFSPLFNRFLTNITKRECFIMGGDNVLCNIYSVMDFR